MMKLNFDKIVMWIIALIIAIGYFVHRLEYEINHPGDDPDIVEVKHDGHVFLTKYAGSRNQQIIHSPSCPCNQVK